MTILTSPSQKCYISEFKHKNYQLTPSTDHLSITPPYAPAKAGKTTHQEILGERLSTVELLIKVACFVRK